MLNFDEEKEFERLCNGEYYAQVDDAGAEAMLDGVKLALVVLEEYQGDLQKNITVQALDFVYTFGNWRTLPLHTNFWYWCMVENYGQEEADYLINEEGWKPSHPGKEGA